uniref:FRIGIDA-like protein n=1 Tax=Fagus sylvatica TaxID=28930 RepID=A0A2N9IXH7_FAGSY
MEGVNNGHALKLYEAVKGFMGKAAEPTTLPSSSSSQGRTRKRKDMSATTKAVAVAKSGAAADAAPSFIECNTPQQTNGYDCGLYVIAIAKVICQWHSSKSKDKESNWISAIERHVDASLEMTMRKEELKKDMDVEVSIVRRTCVLLLAELMRVRQVVKAKVREEAVRLALEWKEKIREGIVVKCPRRPWSWAGAFGFADKASKF